MSHQCDTSEMGASCFAVADVHRIGILDVRLYNTDRCLPLTQTPILRSSEMRAQASP